MPQLPKLRKKCVTSKPANMPAEEWSQVLANRKLLIADRNAHQDCAEAAKKLEKEAASVVAYMQSQANSRTQRSSNTVQSRRSTSPSTSG